MNLLLDEVDLVATAGDPSAADVQGIAYDSRAVDPGDLFCCLPGRTTDGHAFAPEALARGAVGLLCEHVLDGVGEVAQAVVAAGRVRSAMAQVAASFYGHPSRDLVMAGVTGTNGKTTVTHLLGSVLGQAGHPTTVVGTLSGARTTPESTELQRRLAEVRDTAPPDAQAAPAVAMEVSSHALVQSRVDAVHFDVAVFTNLSHEHLDYHESMDAYFEAKASLFTPDRAVRGVVNAEDSWGRRLLADARIPLVAVRRDAAAAVELGAGRSAFTWRGQRVELAMTGLVNVENALLAAEAAVVLGLDPLVVAAGLGAAGPVPGRLEVVATPERGAASTVMVDYAHTPAGLEVALTEARRLAGAQGRVVVVFGCGGERDRTKRPLMGAAATRLADLAILTSDNPRGEDPDAIVAEVLAGVEPSADGACSSGRLVVEEDRRAAIALALSAAGSGDVVVVAGKGHETTQEVAGELLPFDDRAVVAELVGAAAAGD